jgi:predicted dehydrogenase
VALFEFPGGVHAVHRAVGCSNGKRTPWSGDWRIEGPQGSITWEDGRVFVTQEHRADTPRREEIPLATSDSTSSNLASLEEFLSALREQREPECSSRDNLNTMAMTFAARRSAEEGRKVELAELDGCCD